MAQQKEQFTLRGSHILAVKQWQRWHSPHNKITQTELNLLLLINQTTSKLKIPRKIIFMSTNAVVQQVMFHKPKTGKGKFQVEDGIELI